MYLLGHMAMGYLFAFATAKKMRSRLIPWLAFTAGIALDYDILFSGLGLAHHTYTHSLLILLPPTLLIAYFQRASIPYLIATIQHVLVGDFIVGKVPLLLPLSELSVGLNLGMPSAADAILEFGSLLLMISVMLRNGDLIGSIHNGKDDFMIALPLLSMLSLTWLAAGTPEFSALIAYGFARRALSIIAAGHIILGTLMLSWIFRGVVAFVRS